MKLNEIKNRMFGLSDLKGLINENAFDETKWGDFFKKYPQFADEGPTYNNSPELRRALYDYWSSIGKPDMFPNPQDFEKLSPSERKAAHKKFNISRPKHYTPIAYRAIDFPSTDKETRQALAPIDILRSFFESHISDVIAFDDTMFSNNELLTKYLTCIKGLADTFYVETNGLIKQFSDAGIFVGNIRDPFSMFLFLYFVLYCKKYGNKEERYFNNIPAGAIRETVNAVLGIRDKLEHVVEDNMLGEIGLSFDTPLTVQAIAKLRNEYFNYENIEASLSFLKNLLEKNYGNNIGLRTGNTVGDVILSVLYIIKCSDEKQKTLKKDLKNSVLGNREFYFGSFRSFAYYGRYALRKNTVLVPSIEQLRKIHEIFGYPIQPMYDLLTNISDECIFTGIKRLAIDNPDSQDPLRELIFPVFSDSFENACPAEKIFMTAKSVRDVLQTDFSKQSRLGTTGKNVLHREGMTLGEKIDLLFSDASKGLALLKNDAARRLGETRIPQSINNLETKYNTMSNSELIKTGRPMKFWKLLYRDSNTKTQDDIFNFLSSISDPNVVWMQEYNRYTQEGIEQEEGGLGRKSIDIIGRTSATRRDGKTLCFEYQGEQHYRPINVKPADYEYPLYTAMRDTLLSKCGFASIKGRDGRVYYWSSNEFSADEITPEIKNIIISVYSEYIPKLESALKSNETYGEKVLTKDFSIVKEGTGVRKGINTASLKSFTLNEALTYFKDVVRRGANDSVMFDEPPLNGVVPYLCSPCRLADEITTAADLHRDRVKSAIISARQNIGWKMAYVTPAISKSFTEDDFNYTIEQLANNDKSVVFQWNNNGRKEMADYLITMGFKTVSDKPAEQKVQGAESLFEEIVREIIYGDIH